MNIQITYMEYNFSFSSLFFFVNEQKQKSINVQTKIFSILMENLNKKDFKPGAILDISWSPN